MRLFFVFFLLSKLCLAQKTLIVRSSTDEKLAGISIFKISSANNSLAGITDSLGTVSINLEENQKYLFHLLGYTDKVLSTEQLKESSMIVLEGSAYQLDEVNINPKKLKLVEFKTKPGNWNFGESNYLKQVFDRVMSLEIKAPGFLKSFKLYATQRGEGDVRIFKFVLFDDQNGIPGKLLLDKTVSGVLKGQKIIFDLTSLGLYLENGHYFIGYETLNNGSFDFNLLKKLQNRKPNEYIREPMISVKGKKTDKEKAFVRNNLKDWKPFDLPTLKDGRLFFEFAYELEMNVEIDK